MNVNDIKSIFSAYSLPFHLKETKRAINLIDMDDNCLLCMTSPNEDEYEFMEKLVKMSEVLCGK